MPEQQQMTEEQMKEMQEKIKNMSPEELKEFQKKQCIFCHIIEGKVQSKKVYEDDQSLAILDINPATPGHVLLLPKEHYSIMPQLSEDEITHLFNIAKMISNSVLRALEVPGTNIIVQNGIAAGQKAQHFMIHIIPREEKDGINFELPQKEIPEKELEEIRKKLTGKLGGVEETKQLPPPEPDKKTVEAELKEEGPLKKKEEEKPKKAPTKKESKEPPKKKPPTKEKEEKKPEKPKNNDDVSLDDIAKIIGVK
ncbi:MAG: HIT family protein [Nanoarchaeota archaeon]|nr:HIT family protein [Nanoarchaeota archaeon]